MPRSASAWRNQRGAIGPVAEHVFCKWERIDQGDGALVIAALSFGQVQEQRPALAIAYDMQLAGQPASASSDTAG